MWYKLLMPGGNLFGMFGDPYDLLEVLTDGISFKNWELGNLTIHEFADGDDKILGDYYAHGWIVRQVPRMQSQLVSLREDVEKLKGRQLAEDFIAGAATKV